MLRDTLDLHYKSGDCSRLLSSFNSPTAQTSHSAYEASNRYLKWQSIQKGVSVTNAIMTGSRMRPLSVSSHAPPDKGKKGQLVSPVP